MDIPPWISVAITLATPIALGAWHVLAHFTKRHDDVDQRREALADREEERLNQQRDAWVSNIRADLDRSRGLLNDCETDRHLGWERARLWHQLAWTMMGRASQARQLAESMARVANLPPPEWPDGNLDLPPFDAPRPAVTPSRP
jgi:hypothetical protein